MSTRVRTTYVLLMGTWLILVGRFSVPSLALGLVGIALATLVFGQVFLAGGKHRSVPDLLRRAFALACFAPVFLAEAFRAAVKVAYRAVQPRLSFQPGIVRVPTTLTNPSAINLACTLIGRVSFCNSVRSGTHVFPSSRSSFTYPPAISSLKRFFGQTLAIRARTTARAAYRPGRTFRRN